MLKKHLQSLYLLSRNRTAKMVSLFLLSALALEMTNALIILLLGIDNTPLPWSFLTILKYGFVAPVFIAFVLVGILAQSLRWWLAGGIKRALANQMVFYCMSFILLTSLGLFVFSLWEGLNITVYPWNLYWLLKHLPRHSEQLNHLWVSLFGAYLCLFVLIVFKCFSTKTKAEKVFGNAHFASAFEVQKMGYFSEKGIVVGKAFGETLRVPGYESALVVAPTGSGKTTAIAIPNLLEWKGSGVFNDLKGELYRLTSNYRKIVLKNKCFLWSPADKSRKTDCYNPFFYVSKNPDLRIRDLQLIAGILIPEIKLGVGFWYISSREIFIMLSLYLLETQGSATLSEVHDLSKQKDFFEWLSYEIEENRETFSKPLKQNAYSILGADIKTQCNILKDFHSRMELFIDPLVSYATSRNDFDFRALRREKMSIYVNISDSDKDRLSPILTLFWAQIIQVLSDKEPQTDERYGVLALMDEFGNMTRINKLKDGMSFLRSYHMRCIIIVQYLAQITSVYGREDSKGFLNCKVKVTFALNDIDDAQFFSKSLGSKTVKVNSSSISTGHWDRPGSCSENINYKSRALLNPDEIMKLPAKRSVILVESNSPIKATKCYWFKNAYYRSKLNLQGRNQ